MNKNTLSISVIIMMTALFTVGLSAQTVGKIPVYPGARLATEKEGAFEPGCCTFVTNDPLDKVIAFYQSALKARPMDRRQIVAAYPAMAEQIRQVEAQTPAGVKVMSFVLSELEIDGQKVPTVFELVSTSTILRFSVSEKQLTDKDAHFSKQPQPEGGQRAGSGPAGRALIDWKRLQDLLPAASFVEGFKREESLGENHPDGSWANVTYSKDGGVKQGQEETASSEITVTLSIQDVGRNPDIGVQSTTPGADEQAIKVRGRFPGKESSLTNDAGLETCERIFFVSNRFLVECRGERTKSLALLDKFVAFLNLEKLAGLK